MIHINTENFSIHSINFNQKSEQFEGDKIVSDGSYCISVFHGI